MIVVFLQPLRDWPLAGIAFRQRGVRCGARSSWPVAPKSQAIGRLARHRVVCPGLTRTPASNLATLARVVVLDWGAVARKPLEVPELCQAVTRPHHAEIMRKCRADLELILCHMSLHPASIITLQ